MSSLVFTTPDAGASSNHAPVHMPNVVGLTRTQAYAAMKAAQLFFKTRGPGSADGKWVSVTHELPGAGTLVPWRSTVTLTTSMSAVHASRRVPRVVGLTKARVYAAMKSAQLFFKTRGPGSADAKWVAVARQSPAPGTVVAWHATVTITTTMRAPHPRRRVPNVVGMSRARAIAVMHSSQLVLRAVGAGASNNSWTSAARQSPAAGTIVAWHAVVTLSVKRSPPKSLSSTRPTTTTTVAATTTTTVAATTTTTYPGETTTSTSPTTTTTVPVTTTTRKPSKINDYRIGAATWYSYIPGHCATWFLPYGTRITVRDLATGRAIVCTVTDKEAARGDRVVDLSETEFARLAPLAKGVIRVKVTW